MSITTGTPPASVIASGYVVQYGAGQITSSPGSHSTAKAVNTACLPPLVTSTWAAVALEAGVAQGLGGDRLLELGEPAGRRVHVVLRLAARLGGGLDDVCGVGKSGSPAPNPITFSPWALSALALASTAKVADGAIAARRCETLFTVTHAARPAHLPAHESGASDHGL